MTSPWPRNPLLAALFLASELSPLEWSAFREWVLFNLLEKGKLGRCFSGQDPALAFVDWGLFGFKDGDDGEIGGRHIQHAHDVRKKKKSCR